MIIHVPRYLGYVSNPPLYSPLSLFFFLLPSLLYLSLSIRAHVKHVKRALSLLRSWLDPLRIIKYVIRVKRRLDLLQLREALSPVIFLGLSSVHRRIRIVDIHPPLRAVELAGYGFHPSV